MPKQLIIIAVILVLSSWFLLGEKKSPWEKFGIIVVIAGLYIAYRLMSGATIRQILAPILSN